MKKKILITILILTLVSISYFKNINKEDQNILVAKTINENNIKDNEIKKEIEPKEENIIKRLRKEYQNNDIIAAIEIKDTNIKGVITQTNNNTYYLNYNANKKRDPKGSLFMDYRIDIKSSNKILIYGHMSSKNKTPFAYLKNYLKKDYFEKYQDLELITETNTYKYKIFGVTIYKEDYDYLYVDFKTKEEYLSNLNNFLSKAKYKESYNFKPNDKTIFLQTCYPNQKGSYIVLGARLIETI